MCSLSGQLAWTGATSLKTRSRPWSQRKIQTQCCPPGGPGSSHWPVLEGRSGSFHSFISLIHSFTLSSGKHDRTYQDLGPWEVTGKSGDPEELAGLCEGKLHREGKGGGGRETRFSGLSDKPRA